MSEVFDIHGVTQMLAERDAELARLREACDALVLTWRCETCGWETTLPALGFGGDGYYHYEDGVTPCGPLVARRARET